MEDTLLRCAECGTKLYEKANPWMKVEGFERRREAGGTNHIALRRQTGEAVCETCMTKLRAGVASTQMELT